MVCMCVSSVLQFEYGVVFCEYVGYVVGVGDVVDWCQGELGQGVVKVGYESCGVVDEG